MHDIQNIANRFAGIHFPDNEAPNCNLVRKRYHVLMVRASREGDCAKLMSRVDAHSEQVVPRRRPLPAFLFDTWTLKF